jgi:FkbM family methyltransferase
MVLRKTLPGGFRSQPLFVSPDARLAYLFQSLGTAERRLLEWARELVGPGEVVWDIGANCGVFGIAASVLAGPSGSVLAVEPDPFLADLLTRSREALGAREAAVEVVRAAVAERAGKASFHVSARGRAASWLDGSRPSTQAGGSRGAAQVDVLTLDDLLRGRRNPTVVKIDVEGSEARVLDGAERLLGEIRPTLLIEVSGAVAEKVGRRLHANHYQLFDARLNPADRTRLDVPVHDTLAIPGAALADS